MAAKKKCSNCGAVVTIDYLECPECGNKTFDSGQSENSSSSPKSGTSFQASDKQNGIGKALQSIAWIIYVVGFIGGIILGNSDYGFSFPLAFVYWLTSFISGTIFLGFSEIIFLLQQLVDRK